MKNKTQIYIRPVTVDVIYLPIDKTRPILVTVKPLCFMTQKHTKKPKLIKKRTRFSKLTKDFDSIKHYFNDAQNDFIERVNQLEEKDLRGEFGGVSADLLEGYLALRWCGLLGCKPGWNRKKVISNSTPFAGRAVISPIGNK